MKTIHINLTFGGIPIKGTITMSDQDQPGLFNEQGEKVDEPATESQRWFLATRGKFQMGMTKIEAGRLIAQIKKKEEEERIVHQGMYGGFSPSPSRPAVVNEQPKRKRGRPRKT